MDRIEAIREALAALMDSRDALLNMTISDLHRVLDGFPARGGLRLSLSAIRYVDGEPESVEVTLSLEAPEIEIKAAMAELSAFAASIKRDAVIGSIADALIAFERDLFSHVPCQGSIECMRIADVVRERSITIHYQDFAVDIHPRSNRGYDVEVYGDDYSLLLRGASGKALRPIDVIESFRKHVKPLLISPLT
jgi:hypothetical protein